jgi:uncharacterized protein YdaU (DUF1376 family)
MNKNLLRDQPYFPLYCANLLADFNYRSMNLIERGLLLSLITECWHNGKVPEDKNDMTRYLGCEISEIEEALTEKVFFFFFKESGFLKNREVEMEKEKILNRRSKQSEGGKIGQQRKKEKNIKGEPEGQLQGQPEGPLDQFKSNSFKSIHVNQEGESLKVDHAWVNAFDPPSENSYSQASRGY